MSSIMQKNHCQMAHAKQAEYAECMPIRTRLVGPETKSKKRFHQHWILDFVPMIIVIILWSSLIATWFGWNALMVFIIPLLTLIPITIAVMVLDYHVK